MCTEHSDEQGDAKSSQMKKNQKVIELLNEWLADESGYDEREWPAIKKLIEDNRMSYRKRFSDETGE